LSKKTEIALADGEKIAKEFIELTSDFYERVEVGGSIRRRSPIVHDIDICAIARKPVAEYENAVKNVGGKIIRFGGEYATILFQNTQINVLFSTVETWGAGMMWSTGPTGHTIGMNIKADKLGYKFNRTGIRRRSDESLVPTPTEQDIARLLHWDYKPPEMRGIGDKRKNKMYG
jgi:DNA polymerase/3'-5' exonuclease PolX